MTNRADINRANAAHSTGPKSETGKAASSRNALLHGLTSKMTVLPHEDETRYLELLTSLMDTYSPIDANERALVERVADTMWRMQRCYSVETSFFQHRINAITEQQPELHPEAAMALMFVEKEECSRMRLMMRYITSAERAYRQAVADLERTQAQRPEPEEEPVQVEQTAEEEARYRQLMHNIAADAGFVSHNPARGEMHPFLKASLAALPKMNGGPKTSAA